MIYMYFIWTFVLIVGTGISLVSGVEVSVKNRENNDRISVILDNIADSVQSLKARIQDQEYIPVTKQVILTSNRTQLQNGHPLNEYADTTGYLDLQLFLVEPSEQSAAGEYLFVHRMERGDHSMFLVKINSSQETVLSLKLRIAEREDLPEGRQLLFDLNMRVMLDPDSVESYRVAHKPVDVFLFTKDEGSAKIGFYVFVRVVSLNSLVAVKVELTQTIASLKRKLESRLNIPASDQILLDDQRMTLPDDDQLVPFYRDPYRSVNLYLYRRGDYSYRGEVALNQKLMAQL